MIPDVTSYFWMFSKLQKLNCRETPSPIPEIFLCDLLTPHGFSGRNFLRGVICTLTIKIPCSQSNFWPLSLYSTFLYTSFSPLCWKMDLLAPERFSFEHVRLNLRQPTRWTCLQPASLVSAIRMQRSHLSFWASGQLKSLTTCGQFSLNLLYFLNKVSDISRKRSTLLLLKELVRISQMLYLILGLKYSIPKVNY